MQQAAPGARPGMQRPAAQARPAFQQRRAPPPRAAKPPPKNKRHN